jgi:PPOX class probable F420-dependent enzyme
VPNLPTGVTTAEDRFATARVAHLATVNANGHPHLIPVTFALAMATVYIAIDHKPKTTRELRRIRNIRTNPAVTLLVDHYDDQWTNLWWARADGTATILDAPATMRKPIDLLVAKYPQYQAVRPEGPVIAVEVHKWADWSYT